LIKQLKHYEVGETMYNKKQKPY